MKALDILAWVSICCCLLSCIFIMRDITHNPQRMKIMNVVWPVTALYAGPLALWAYYLFGRQVSSEANRKMARHAQTLFWQSVLKGALHCGSGCTLGDLLSASVLLLVPVTVFGSKLAGDWLIEYIAAFLIGIIFQYYAIKPMRPEKSSMQVLFAALKADTLSLTCWQIGMYGWMAVSNFLIFHRQLKADETVFWLMMQIGMIFGLATAYPVNWWLIRKGIKEPM